jgi:L-amino acid N-acyltransferase YncA
MQTAMDWAGKKGASLWRATVSIEDEEKQALFESLGFSKSNQGTNFDLDDREVEGILLQRT